jgi:DNA-binding MarR family transcriptional regulator
MKTKIPELKGSHPTKELAESWRRERPDLDLRDFLLGIYLMRIGRMLDDAYDRMCHRAYGISGADMRVLFALRRAGLPYARRPTDLFRALLVTSGAMTKQVDRLSARRFVERRRDPGQSTRLLIQLTKQGLRVADQAAESLARRSLISGAMASMSASERTAGEGFSERLLSVLEASELSPPALAEGADTPRRVLERARTRVHRKVARRATGKA